MVAVHELSGLKGEHLQHGPRPGLDAPGVDRPSVDDDCELAETADVHVGLGDGSLMHGVRLGVGATGGVGSAAVLHQDDPVDQPGEAHDAVGVEPA